MNPTDYAAALRRDGARMADTATDLHRRVPACPEWDVADLLWHTGEVHLFWRSIASGLVSGPAEYTEPKRPGDDELVEWFREGVETAASVLGGIDPAKPAWTWSRQQDAGFIQRRMAHETAVHCQDALAAAGLAEPIERELAVDGIDEFVSVFLPGSPGDVDIDVHLHTTDGEGEWHVVPGNDGWVVSREHRKAAAAVRGPASDLLLLLWRRRNLDGLPTFGDEDGLRRFLAAPKLA